MAIEYFGTLLNQAGHYFWRLAEGDFYRSKRDYNSCPFNPEALPYFKDGEARNNGTTEFYHFAGFTICAIEGSCYDQRPRSKTIFFVEEQLTEEEMKHRILSVPIAKHMLEKMPFTVMW